MLLDLGGKPLIWWAWKAACEAVDPQNVVVAMPASEENDELADTVQAWTPDWGEGDFVEPQVFRWDGDEADVLGRFYHCAHERRWHPDTIISRITPDDPRKSPTNIRRVIEGERLPVELGGEAFTLAMLDKAHQHVSSMDGFRNADGSLWADPAATARLREHITHALFGTPPPPPPPGTWTVDTQSDLDAIRKEMGF